MWFVLQKKIFPGFFLGSPWKYGDTFISSSISCITINDKSRSLQTITGFESVFENLVKRLVDFLPQKKKKNN